MKAYILLEIESGFNTVQKVVFSNVQYPFSERNHYYACVAEYEVDGYDELEDKGNAYLLELHEKCGKNVASWYWIKTGVNNYV